MDSKKVVATFALHGWGNMRRTSTKIASRGLQIDPPNHCHPLGRGGMTNEQYLVKLQRPHTTSHAPKKVAVWFREITGDFREISVVEIS